MVQKEETKWNENNEIFYLASFACRASEARALENPQGAGKEVRKWAGLIKTIYEAIEEEGPDNTPSEVLQLIKRQKKKIRQISNSISTNGKDPHLREKVEFILSKCTLDIE